MALNGRTRYCAKMLHVTASGMIRGDGTPPAQVCHVALPLIYMIAPVTGPSLPTHSGVLQATVL